MYDCLHDGDASRRLANQAIKDVYNDTEGMTEEMFRDATEQVQILGKMTKRGNAGSVGSSSTPRMGGGAGGEEGSTPRAGSSISTPRTTRSVRADVVAEVGSADGV